MAKVPHGDDTVQCSLHNLYRRHLYFNNALSNNFRWQFFSCFINILFLNWYFDMRITLIENSIFTIKMSYDHH